MVVSKLFPKVIILFSIFVKINKNKLVDAPVCRQQTEGQILGISYKKPATILCEVRKRPIILWVIALLGGSSRYIELKYYTSQIIPTLMTKSIKANDYRVENFSN